MARTFYEVIGAAQDASAEAISELYALQFDSLSSRVARGDEDARIRLWALHEAHGTLSDPIKRAMYDQQLRHPVGGAARVPNSLSRATSRPRVTEPAGGHSHRTGRSSHSAISNIVMGLVALAVMGAGYLSYRESVRAEEAVQAARIARDAEIAAARIAAERLKAETERARIAAEAAQAERSQELRARSEAIQRGNQVAAESSRTSQMAAMERKRQERLEAVAKERDRQTQDRYARAEQAYWSCMKSALEHGSADQAKARCQGLQMRR